MIAASRLRRVSIWLTTAALLPGMAFAQDTGGIPWNRNLTITRTSSDDDIKNVFRSMLQANGLSVVFAPSVKEKVSFHLESVPIEQAFTQLVDEHNLTYNYNPATKTVSMNTANGGGSASSSADRKGAVFVTLNATTFPEVVQAINNLGLGIGGLKYDSSSRILAISGDPDRTKQIQTLVENLEAMRKRQGPANGKGGPEEVKVIPLRFTDVGPSTRQFQGKTVTVPGIAETLRTALGLDDKVNTAAGAEATAPTFAAYGAPRISIDPRTNSVVVQGTPRAIAAVEKIINQLDRPLQMVEIEVLIVTANVGVARQLGVNWRFSRGDSNPSRSYAVDTGTTAPNNNTGSGAVGGQSGGLATDLYSSSGLDALSLLPAGPAGATAASFVIRGGQAVLQAQLQALAAKDRARILSAPKLVTLDNITARITRSQNIYVQVDTRSPSGGGLGGVGLQEIQTGLTLEITPSIVPAQSDREQSLVRLNLRAENSAPGTGTFGQIDVNSQEVQTNVLVPDADTFVIGGLFDDSQINSTTGVPYLKDIPLLGELFKTTRSQKSLGETIFFITPRIVDERSVLQGDIAVKEGSMEYIRRARAELNDPSLENGKPQKPRSVIISTLEEDE